MQHERRTVVCVILGCLVVVLSEYLFRLVATGIRNVTGMKTFRVALNLGFVK